jgi:hypothetical protein
MINVTCLVHVGCHLITTCRPRHRVNGHGRDGWMKIGERRRYGRIVEGGHKQVGHQHKGLQISNVPNTNMSGTNMSGREHVGCQLKGLQCTGREHVGRQLKGLHSVTLLGVNKSGMNMY